MGYAVEIKNVTKQFKGAVALKNVTVAFEKGKISGVIGRNGSGKTVLFKCICGLMPITEGEITVLGQSVGDGYHVPQGIGAIIESPGFLPNISGYANLRYLAELSGKADRYAIQEAMALMGLDPNMKKHVGKYSLGMRQRLGLAQALMDKPDLLVLDEPMNGLDNQGVESIRNLLKSLSQAGTTILLASHSSEDIKYLCDDVYRMNCGAISKEPL